jgi:AMP-polyphosphate phosphotransferase
VIGCSRAISGSLRNQGVSVSGRLDGVDLSVSMSREDSEARLQVLQPRLLELNLVAAGLLGNGALGPPLCVVFEGWDASGKGGSIKRLAAPLDPRHVTVAEFGVPTEEQKRHHFLWRFVPSLPGWGEMSVFDRSWYGRVLVERVEGFATGREWKRAYQEINDFERMLVEEGALLVKFWLHISSDEQLRRFEQRRDDPLRRWKLTEDDWRNRSKRSAYVEAAEEMFERTDSRHAPWDIVAAESKHYARVAVLETVVSRAEQSMKQAGLKVPVLMA